MEVVASHVRTRQFHQREACFETEAGQAVMNEVRLAMATFEKEESGRFEELAQKSAFLESELATTRSHVQSLTTEYQAHLSSAALMLGAAQRQ